MIKLTVVIPVYNAERYLRRCLDSVLSQTLRELQVVCVDDGSSDGSPAILAEYAFRDPRVSVVAQDNSGQGAARNLGLEIAHGDYVYFLDADDALADADALRYLTAEMDGANLQLLMFDAETRFEDGADAHSAALGHYRRRRSYSAVVAGSELFAAMNRRGEFSVSPCLYVVRRTALEASGLQFREGMLHEDDVFTLSLLLALDRVSHRNRPLYDRWVHPGSTMTAAAAERHLQGYLACIDWVDARIGERTLPGPVLRELRRCRIGYRHAARSLAAKSGLPPVVDYPLSEKVVNLFRCLRDRGLAYTLKRILKGGRPA